MNTNDIINDLRRRGLKTRQLPHMHTKKKDEKSEKIYN